MEFQFLTVHLCLIPKLQIFVVQFFIKPLLSKQVFLPIKVKAEL